jgi:predicted dinucleotide-binding enzyme
MKIGIIGAGNVGGTLGRLFAAHGHHIVFGVRDSNSARVLDLLGACGENTRAGNIAEAVAFGDVIILAIRWPAAADVIANAGDWTGKIVIDAMNRLGPPVPGSGPSSAEDVARLAPGARVVKAFNTTGANNYANPRFGDQTASMFICGDDAEAKAVVGQLVEQLEFELVDAGPLSNAALLEKLAELWVALARGGMGREIAFKLLKR